MDGEIGLARSIIDDLHSSFMEVDQMEGEMWVTQRIVMKFILRISKEIK